MENGVFFIVFVIVYQPTFYWVFKTATNTRLSFHF